jgi:hypothetical protein
MSFPNPENPADDIREFLTEMREIFSGVAGQQMLPSHMDYVIATYRRHGMLAEARELDISRNGSDAYLPLNADGEYIATDELLLLPREEY